MKMQIFVFANFIFLGFLIYLARAEVHVSNVDMRPPKLNDIGLIFDLTLTNTAELKKGGYEVKVRCEKCCIALPNNETTCDTIKMMGGSFGFLDPGATKTVSIIWPTVTLFNRVGSCDMVIISHNNATEGKARIGHTVKFDTMLTSGNVPGIMKQFVYGLNITDCTTLDLNPFKKCVPLNCEEKYFGKRSFFNHTNNLCEPVPNCTGSGLIYDFIINECVDGKHPICMEDIHAISSGKFDNNSWKYNKVVPHWYTDYYGYPDEAKEVGLRMKRQVVTPWATVVNAFLIVCLCVACFIVLCLVIYLISICVSKVKEYKDQKVERNRK